MPTLTDMLLAPGNRPKVIADCTQLINEEVDSKGGLTGLAVKGYALVKANPVTCSSSMMSAACGRSPRGDCPAQRISVELERTINSRRSRPR